MLTAIYGGAFDPVHNGHLAVARAAAAALHAQVRLLPTGDARHRAPAHATGEQRVAMLRLAVQGEPMLTVDAREVQRAGATYSFDTLTELREELGPDAPIAMIVGADAFLGLPAWHHWRALFDLAHLVVAERPGVVLPGGNAKSSTPAERDVSGALLGDAESDPRDTPAVALQAATRLRWVDTPDALQHAPAGRILRLRLPLRPESSSAIRTRLGAGASVDGMVPPVVEAYLREHRLYV